MPIFLLTGPFIPDFVIASTSLFIILFFRDELFNLIKEEKIFIFFILFWLCMVLSSIFSDNPLYSLKSSFFYFRFIFFSVAVFYLISLKPQILEKFLYFLKLSIYILCAASIFEFIFEHNIFLQDKPSYRLTGTFGDEQIVGSFISKMLPIILSIFLYLKKKFNMETFFLLGLSLIIGILSNERGAIFYIICFFVFFITIFPGLKFKDKFLYYLLTIITFLVILFSVEETRKRLVDLTLSQAGIWILESQSVADFQGYSKSDRLHFQSAAHETHIITALKMFKDNPILGVGPKMFRKKCDDPKFYISSTSCTTHPHNILAQILAETGIIGLSFFIVAIIYILKQFYLAIKYRFKYDAYLLTSKLCLIFFFFTKFIFFNSLWKFFK